MVERLDSPAKIVVLFSQLHVEFAAEVNCHNLEHGHRLLLMPALFVEESKTMYKALPLSDKRTNRSCGTGGGASLYRIVKAAVDVTLYLSASEPDKTNLTKYHDEGDK